MQRWTSPRVNKGKPPPPFDWTCHGQSWAVGSKQLVLPRQVGGSRVHITPRSMIRKSSILCAGNGLYLCQGVPRAGFILSEYFGRIISIHEADHLKTLVRSSMALRLFTELISQSHIFFVIERAKQHMSFVSEIPFGAWIRRFRMISPWNGM